MRSALLEAAAVHDVGIPEVISKLFYVAVSRVLQRVARLFGLF